MYWFPLLVALVATYFEFAVLGDYIASHQWPQFDGSGNSFGIPGNASYDYIVVGGGTAGNAIAVRLAQESNSRVAVVEAGGFYQIEDGNRSVVPGYAPGNVAPGGLPSPLTDWGFLTTMQPGLLNRSIPYARGKTLGGSSALNFMAYHRPTIGTFQAWVDAVGDDSYAWDEVLPYYQRSATFTPPSNTTRFANSTPVYDLAAFNDSLNGPLQVSYPNYSPVFPSWIQLGMEAVGIPIGGDMSLGTLSGSNWISNTINPENEHRSSSQTSYLRTAIENTNLVIYTHALAKRILFDSNKTAIGVEVASGTQTYTLSATKEVILSAGAFQSPQLLMLSGIGPELTLSNFGIPIIAALEGVGQNMWDHPYFWSAYAVNLETSTLLRNSSSPYTLAAEAAYINNGTGPLTGFGSILAWENLPQPLRSSLSNATLEALAQFPDDWPELEYLVSNGYSGGVETQPGLNYAQLAGAVVTPLSRGTVTLNSTDAADLPIIDPGFLTNPADIELAIAAIKRQREVWATSVMKGILIGEEFQPGPNVTTDAEIEHYLRETTIQVFHPCCTSKMGMANDTMAVVDSRARVFGVAGLRVVDASAFPFLPPGHPQATVYMLAEKIADDIRNGR